MTTALAIPAITALICYVNKNVRLTGYLSLTGSIIMGLFAASSIIKAFEAPLKGLGGMLYMDALSGYMMAIVVSLAIASSAYSIGYIEHEFRAGLTDTKGVSGYYALLHLFVLTMLLITVANNLALMWIAIEATTIVSALLIGLGFYKRELAIEAAWKYIILCTVGIIFAFLGTFIAYYASTAITGGSGYLNWTDLRGIAKDLNPATMRLAFIFILLGYGTKSGLAPVHNWLPDAHTQAPSPISALLSGILLNTAFYGVIRFVSIVSPSTGSSFTGDLLIVFGLLSVATGAIFIVVQENYKRLLAYSSIEHMGIISLGIGIGTPVGIYGALLHILNHAISKPLMFFISGKIQSKYGSTSIDSVNGILRTMPFFGALTFIGFLSLTGVPPFNIFISEFSVLMAGVDRQMWFVSTAFLIFIVMVFYGMLSSFGRMLLGSESLELRESVIRKFTLSGALSNTVMGLMALAIVIMGLHIPDALDRAIRICIEIVGVR